MIGEDLIWEVLVRLPTKSLMRFKCVSKVWYSIIRSPKFAISHGATGGGCFRGLLIRDIYYNSKCWVYEAQTFFYVNLNDCPKMQHQLTIHEPEQYSSFTPVVKGLIGMYDNGSDFTLCNIATHELLKLPPSPSRPPYACCEFEFYYSLGFDVVNEVFKVLSICHCFDEDNNIISRTTHVFNLGVNNSDTNWREIAPTPLDLYVKEEQCLCIDGVLYWWLSDDLDDLTVFHISNETFETIAPPEFSLRESSAELVEICGKPALVVIELKTDCDSTLNVWTMRRGGELDEWTRKRVVLPPGLYHATVLNYSWTRKRVLKYAATVPTGKMMLSFGESPRAPLCIYTYDHLKNEFDSITVEEYGFDWGVTDSRQNVMDSQLNGWQYEETKICYYEENIIPLALLMSNQKREAQTINGA